MQANENSGNTEKLRANVLNIFVLFVIPMAVGLFCVSDGVIALIGGNEYIEATASLRILSVSILCAAAASFMTYIVIIPEGREKVMLTASTASAAINVVLNIFLIPIIQQEGAALTTAIAEFVVFAVEYKAAGIKLKEKSAWKNIITVIAASAMIIVCNIGVRFFVKNIVIATIIIIIMSIVVYFATLCMLKNEYALTALKRIDIKKKID